MTTGIDRNEELECGDDVVTTRHDMDPTNKEQADCDVPTGSSSEDDAGPSPLHSNSADDESDEHNAGDPPAMTTPGGKTKSNNLIAKCKRFLRYFVTHWPRTISLVVKMCCLFILILWSLLTGFILSNMEGPAEIASNDAVVMNAYLVAALPFNLTRNVMVGLPTTCLINFLEAYNESGVDLSFAPGNATFDISNKSNFTFDVLPGESNTSISTEEFFLEFFPNISFPDIDVKDLPTVVDLYLYMNRCQETASYLLNALVSVTKRVVEATRTTSEELTFNWIRCWNASDPELGTDRNPWIPNSAQVNASNNQATYFQKVWMENRESLQNQYVQEWNCFGNETNETMCLLNAREASVVDATGAGGCSDNTGSSAWFWFTVMTTVGYGNQSPVTSAGRAFVSGLGWLTIMAFGAITVLTSLVWKAIIDDFLKRMKLEQLSRPSIATPVWGLAAIAWIAVIAEGARTWWVERVPGYEFTKADSYWFGYISVLTVGLGDFYLQPQGLFLGDVFTWASRMLSGFVIVSTFLGKAADLVYLWFPPRKETFAEYLARTDLWGNSVNAKPSKSLHTLERMEDQEKEPDSSFVGDEGSDTEFVSDDKAINYHRIQTLAKKKCTLIHLLQDAQDELDRRVAKYESHEKDGTQDAKNGLEFSVADLLHEEEVLGLLLQRTQEARARLEQSRMESGEDGSLLCIL